MKISLSIKWRFHLCHGKGYRLVSCNYIVKTHVGELSEMTDVRKQGSSCFGGKWFVNLFVHTDILWSHFSQHYWYREPNHTRLINTSSFFLLNRLIFSGCKSGCSQTHQDSHNDVESEAWWVTCLGHYMLATQSNLDWSSTSASYLGCHSPKRKKGDGRAKSNKENILMITSDFSKHPNSSTTTQQREEEFLPENMERVSQVTERQVECNKLIFIL